MDVNHYTLGFRGLRSGFRAFVGFRPVWRFWGHYFNPLTYWRWVRRFVQRGLHGYAGNDYWDADSYLEVVIYGVLKDLRKNTHGFPASVADIKAFDENLDGREEHGMGKWQAILDEILVGIEAARELRIEDTIPAGVYSDGPWHMEPCEDNPEYSRMVDESNHVFNQELYDEWAAPLIRKKKRAMYLLCKYWGAFWD